MLIVILIITADIIKKNASHIYSGLQKSENTFQWDPTVSFQMIQDLNLFYRGKQLKYFPPLISLLKSVPTGNLSLILPLILPH